MKKMTRLTAEQRKLVENHLPIVYWVIREEISVNETICGFEYDDLYQEGCLWLCHAAASYDTRLAKFPTYAKKVVRNGLLSYCNELVLELAILSYNILRMIGQESLGKRNPHLKRAVKRRRHRTFINNLINMACHVTEHARKPIIGLEKSNVWRDVFRHVYYAFEYFAL